MEKPFERCYWVNSNFLAGFYPGGKTDQEMLFKLQQLKRAGIRAIIDLTEEGELRPYAAAAAGMGLEHLRMPIVDLGVPTLPQMEEILDAIDQYLSQGMPVYVHCWGGIGRTGTVVGCWLKRHGVKNAVEEIHRLRMLAGDPTLPSRRSPETPEQIKMIED